MKRLFAVPYFSEYSIVGIHENANREKLKNGEKAVYETVFRMEWIPGLNVFPMMVAEKVAARHVWIMERDTRLANVLDFMGIPYKFATGETPTIDDTILLWMEMEDDNTLTPKLCWYIIHIE